MNFIGESDDTGPNVIQDIREILQELKATETDLRNSNIGKKLDESILDANILNAASDMIQKCLNSLQASSSNYDPTVFADKLVIIKYNFLMSCTYTYFLDTIYDGSK